MPAAGFGLLAVNLGRNSVEVLAELAPYRPRLNLPQRRCLLKAHASRHGDPTQGGSVRQPIMTAYRQQALVCAAALRDGPMRPQDLKPVAPDAGRILSRNVYGWFERVERGFYRLTADGFEALPLGRRAILIDTPRSNHQPPSYSLHRMSTTVYPIGCHPR